jgi:hypothetical protein
MGFFGTYSYKNKKGELYYLHLWEKGKKKIFHFSKDAIGAVDLPPGYEVIESQTTGMPVLRRLVKKK